MANKRVLLYNHKNLEYKYMTTFSVNPREETVYAEDLWNNGDGFGSSTVELAVNLEGMIKMRDALNYAIKKTKQYRWEA